MSGRICVVPLYGTCVSSMPAACLNISPVRWIRPPTPEEAKVSLPGFALARATKSCTDFAGEDAGTTKAIVPSAMRATGAKSRCMSKLRLGCM